MKRSEIRKSMRHYPVWGLRIISFVALFISPFAATWTLWKDAWEEYLEETGRMWNIATGKEPIED